MLNNKMIPGCIRMKFLDVILFQFGARGFQMHVPSPVLSLFSKLKCEIRFCNSVNSPSVSISLSRGAIHKDYQFSFFEILAIAGFKETGRACQTLGHHAISDCSFNRSSGAFTCRYGADLTNIVTSTWSKIANRFPLLRRVLVDDKTDITSSSCFISCDEEEMASDGEEKEKSGRSRYCMHSPDLWSEETRRCVGVVDFCASA